LHLLHSGSPVNPKIATLKPQSNRPSYSNTVTGTQAVDGWAHPSTASVPVTVLLYDGLLFCGFSVAIKGLTASNAHRSDKHVIL